MKSLRKSRRIKVSFSSGRSSAYMLYLLLKRYRDDPNVDLAVTMCNTSQEDPRSLVFADKIDREWNVGIVWLEAEVHEGAGNGTTHRVVDFETAKRNGEVFEAVIAKYGIPNPTFRNLCNRELKLRPMDSYCRSIGWETGSYDTAIGIRADEVDRVNPRFREKRLIYPLIDAGITKADVLAFWAKQPFDLELPDEHFGNCVWCWKKSLRKHLTLAKEAPEVFDFPRRMELEYADAGAGPGNRRFFRENRTVADIFALAQKPFVPFRSEKRIQFPLLPIDMPAGSCGESCEPYGDDEELKVAA